MSVPIKGVFLAAGLLLSAAGPVAAQQQDHAAGHRHGAGGGGAAWTSFPVILPDGGQWNRRAAALRVHNMEAGEAAAFPPVEKDARRIALEPKGGALRLESGKSGGYHIVTARQAGTELVVTASTVHYFANPGPAPRAMLAQPKSELEIVPAPLPREHQHYRETESWPFEVRFDGRPLAGAVVAMVTERGTTRSLISDAEGRIEVTFPADIPLPATDPAADRGGGHRHGGGRQFAKFVLATEHVMEGRTFAASFNAAYASGPYAGRSPWTGIGFAALGMVLAAPLLRRRPSSRESVK